MHSRDIPPEAGLAIRDAAEEDLAAIWAIYGHHVRTGTASFEEEAPSVEEMAGRYSAVHELGLPYLVAEAGPGGIVGYAYVSRYRARPAYRFTLENSVYVAPGMAGRGIGRALLGALISRCEKGPWRQMVAIIGDSANQASIKLHAAHGFEMAGTLRNVGFKHGRWLDTVLMQRALGSGAASSPDLRSA